jgi:hypothetical protein
MKINGWTKKIKMLDDQNGKNVEQKENVETTECWMNIAENYEGLLGFGKVGWGSGLRQGYKPFKGLIYSNKK